MTIKRKWMGPLAAATLISAAFLHLHGCSDDALAPATTETTQAIDSASSTDASSASADPHAFNHYSPSGDGRAPTAIPPPPVSGRAHLSNSADPDAKFTHFRVGNRNVKQLMADGELIWVGTSGGVIRYNIHNDDYRLFDLRSGLLANGIFHLSKHNNRLVVGTYGGGLSLYDESREGWDTYNIPEGLGDAFVYDFLESGSGDIWIATWSGVNRVRQGALDDNAQWELHTVASTNGGLPNDWVYALANGKQGEVWLATEGGLARYQNGQWSNWDHKDGLGAAYDQVKDQLQFANDPARYSQHHTRQKTEMDLEDIEVAYNPNYIVALTVDSEGVVWAGTWGGGLARFDGKEWRNYTVADGLPANHVFALHRDRQGRLWVGTSKGLALMQGDHFTQYGTDDGLFSEIVFSITTTDDGSIWVGSYGGAARIAKLQ